VAGVPFPTTVRASLTVPRPVGNADVLVEKVAHELRRAGVGGVTPGKSIVSFDSSATSALEGSAGFQQPSLFSAGDVEVLERDEGLELVAEADIGRLPLAFGSGTLLAATLAGGLHTISVTGGLIGGALIAIVPWLIARQRLRACLRRAARDDE